MKNKFKYRDGNLEYPIFFPDATRAVVKTIDSKDIVKSKTPGALVNTYHLYMEMGDDIQNFGDVNNFMGYGGAVISDSGGFQVYSLAKAQGIKDAVVEEGVIFKTHGKKTLFTPEVSIRYQFKLNTDLMVVLDDFTEPGLSKNESSESVERTIKWAKKSKEVFEDECEKRKISEKDAPYLCGVVQGGNYLDLRTECAERLGEMGFKVFGYGGWPLGEEENLMLPIAKVISESSPENSLLYGLGVGKPEDVLEFYKLGYKIFDCVLPTRDARHGRLYAFNFDSIDEIDFDKKDFYINISPKKERFRLEKGPVSKACDCMTCKNYSLGYLSHLFKINDISAYRLATIHNLRFYSLLMEKLREKI